MAVVAGDLVGVEAFLAADFLAADFLAADRFTTALFAGDFLSADVSLAAALAVLDDVVVVAAVGRPVVLVPPGSPASPSLRLRSYCSR
jgi:hypothetical protein